MFGRSSLSPVDGARPRSLAIRRIDSPRSTPAKISSRSRMDRYLAFDVSRDACWKHSASLTEPTPAARGRHTSAARRLSPVYTRPDEFPESSLLLTLWYPHATPPFSVSVATTP